MAPPWRRKFSVAAISGKQFIRIFRRAVGPGGAAHLRSILLGQRPMIDAIRPIALLGRLANNEALEKLRAKDKELNYGLTETEALLPIAGRILFVEWQVPASGRSAGDWTLLSFISTIQKLGIRVGFHPVSGEISASDLATMKDLGVRLFPDLDHGLEWGSKAITGLTVLLARPEVAMLALTEIRRRTNARIIYYTHDLHHLRLAGAAELERSRLLRWDAKRVKKLESRIFSSVDHVLSPSQEEKEVIKTMTSVPVSFVPPFYFSPSKISGRTKSSFFGNQVVLFLGNFAHNPNVDAVNYLADTVMPLVWKTNPGAKLVIAGNSPPAGILVKATDRIEVTGHVPDLGLLHSQARLMAAPLRYGAGVKGKVVDALRRGLPVVGSEVAWQGITTEGFMHKPVPLEPSIFSSSIVALLDDDLACAKLSADAVQIASRGFSENTAEAVFRKVLT